MKRAILVIAIVLIAIGVVSLAYQGITYTTQEKVVEIGPFKATAEKEKTIPLPPVLGGLALPVGWSCSSSQADDSGDVFRTECEPRRDSTRG